MALALTLALIVVRTGCAPASAPPADAAVPGPAPTAIPTPVDEPAPPATATSVPIVEPAPTPDERPNIIVFMTDDQTVDEMVAMPATQALLFDRGMTFDQSFVNLPICCPSRATFLTGQHAANHGVLSNAGVNGGFANFEGQDATLATALQASGYHTIQVGKYLNGFGFLPPTRYTPPGWSDFNGFMAPTEVLYHSTAVWANGQIERPSGNVQANDLLTSILLASLEAAPNDQPIFAWASYPAPHAQAGTPLGEFSSRSHSPGYLNPPIPADRHVGLFNGVAPPATANVGNSVDKPEFLARPPVDATAVQTFYQAALESLLSVDESVATIIDHVERPDADRETWFIFTSDNGILIGEHGVYGGKYLPYEETVRVPLGIRGPGVAPGSTSFVVSNVDLAPTIIDLAGAVEPRDSDGRSLVPLLTGAEAVSGRAILIEGFEVRPKSPPYRAVHTGDSVYVEWRSGDRELYDLTADPYQLRNLVEDSDDASIRLLERNRTLLAELVACAGEACRFVGSELPVPGPPNR